MSRVQAEAPEADFLHRTRARLVLEDGTTWPGWSFGAKRSVNGEAVFQTGMVGYEQSLTDPSYHKQLLALTYPLIGNYGAPGKEAKDELGLHPRFERDRIYARALIVSEVTHKHSHWEAAWSLHEWMEAEGVPGISGIDTRRLTKHMRSHGCMLAKLIVGDDDDVGFEDPNATNLVAEVSVREPVVYNQGGSPRIVAVDCGMKNNQIRILARKGCEVRVVPWNHDLVAALEDADGLFLSNGPGDPAVCADTVQHVQKALALDPPKPVFGICLGNQLLARAAGASTFKLPFGNRGHNIPAVDLRTGRCYITTQNHGFAVDPKSLPEGWVPLFTNANDFTNEGIMHVSKPFFSVQFHPEACAGPEDTMFLFDTFLDAVRTGSLPPPPQDHNLSHSMRLGLSYNHGLKKVVVLGSGGLSIGQAGEFDYSGSQALKALKEEGVYAVLINPNIATVQTSKGLAAKVYYVPVTPEFVTQVLEQERPDGVLLNFGGQTALNCGVELHKRGVFQRLGVRVLGTQVETIIKTEDRSLFAAELDKIKEPVAKSFACANVEEALKAADDIGFPVIIRAAFALGGLGSGFADNRAELKELCTKAFASSPQVLVERSMKGWKEIEYEVVRDQYDNCITVCNMENFDPLGVHTGDSIVVAPSQTLSDREYQMLRTCAIKVVRHLGVVGECNIQYALNPHSLEFCIIEVNARLSRSSALASKATGYPLAFVAAKLSIGIPLPTIRNSVTKETTACFEPSLDYVVVKMPRWDLNKFGVRVSKHISSAMKSVGEVMAVGRNFEETLQKAMRMVTDYRVGGFEADGRQPDDEELRRPTDSRIFFIAAAFEAGQSVEHVHALTDIDRWFLEKLHRVVALKTALAAHTIKTVPAGMLLECKQAGLSDVQIAKSVNSTQANVRTRREDTGVLPVIKQIDTVAAEFPAHTNYLYVTYAGTESDITPTGGSVMVLGSGAYRIGSSVEFDWCAVSCIRTLQRLGHSSIMLNCNPETVSTDYDECDKLYFEEESLERVLDLYRFEQALGVVVSVGGQIPNNLAMHLFRNNVNILGTSPEMIDRAENRYKFSRMLDLLEGVDQPQWKEATSMSDACKFCDSVGYPVLVRPSYVLSGAAMNVAYSHNDLQQMLTEAATVSSEYPVVVSKFILGAKEIEVDAVASEGEIVVGAVSEHVENAGVHSGDATLVLPAQDLSAETRARVVDAARKIARSLQVTGPVNIQFLAKDNDVKVIECNLRASRSFPFASKTVNRDFIEIATRVMLGQSAGYSGDEAFGSNDVLSRVGVKVAQFSFPRLLGADPVLGVEMASTGEVACFGLTREEAYVKALMSTGFTLPSRVVLLSIGSYKDKTDFLESARLLDSMGFKLLATHGTAEFLQEHGVTVTVVNWMLEEDMSAMKDSDQQFINTMLQTNHIDLIINTPSQVRYRRQSSVGYRMRRMAVDFAVPLIVNIKCAKLLVTAVHNVVWKGVQGEGDQRGPVLAPVQLRRVDFVSSNETVILPGLVDMRCVLAGDDGNQQATLRTCSAAALKQGFTVLGLDDAHCKLSTASSINAFLEAANNASLCDFNVWTTATTHETDHSEVSLSTLGLLSSEHGPRLNAAIWQKHIDSWPKNSPFVVSASLPNAAEAVLFAALASRAVHLTGVKTQDHIHLVQTCRAKGIKVSCDMSPHHLFLCKDDVDNPRTKPLLVSYHDQESLWKNLDAIDFFVSDLPPFTLPNTLPLLLDAVHRKRLTLEQLTAKLHTNPCALFDIPHQKDTYVEIDLDEHWDGLEGLEVFDPNLSPRQGYGKVRRVVVRDCLVCVEGTLFVEAGFGGHIPRVAPVPHDALPDTPAVRPDESGLHVPVESLMLSPARRSMSVSDAPKPFGSPALAKWFLHRSIVSVTQFNKATLGHLLAVSREMHTQTRRRAVLPVLQGCIVGCVFFEPSTRTHLSFDSAVKRLGGQVMAIDTREGIVKDESLMDTMRMIDSYADAIVMRHPESGVVAHAAQHCTKPVLSAGEGLMDHPTQAVLDIYTIIEERGTVNGLTVTVFGDVKNSRAANSFVRLLGLYDVAINYVCPPSLTVSDEIHQALESKGIRQQHTTSLEEVLPHTDVLYVARIKDDDPSAGMYKITLPTLSRAKGNLVLLHPLPRGDEVSEEVDGDPRAAYFRQAQYGVYVRMAMLALVLGKA